MKTKYIKCSCAGELISLEKWDDHLICLSLWERGFKNNNKLTFGERIRWCWEILRTGKPFTDSVLLGKEGIDDMVDALKELKNESPNYN